MEEGSRTAVRSVAVAPWQWWRQVVALDSWQCRSARETMMRVLAANSLLGMGRQLAVLDGRVFHLGDVDVRTTQYW